MEEKLKAAAKKGWETKRREAVWEAWVAAEEANAEAYSEETAATAEEAWDEYLLHQDYQLTHHPTEDDTRAVQYRADLDLTDASIRLFDYADSEDIQANDAVMVAWEEAQIKRAISWHIGTSSAWDPGMGYDEARAASAFAHAAYQGAIARGKGEDAEPVIEGILRNAVLPRMYIQDYQDRLAGRKAQAEARKAQAEAHNA